MLRSEIFIAELIEDKISEGLSKGMKQGMAQGMKQGMAQGKALGMAQGVAKVVKGMLSLKMKDEDIKRAANITTSELEKIKKEVNA